MPLWTDRHGIGAESCPTCAGFGGTLDAGGGWFRAPPRVGRRRRSRDAATGLNGASARGSEHREQHGSGRHRAEDVDREPARADDVHEHEQHDGDDRGGDAEERDEREPEGAVAGFAFHVLALLERPVCELGGHQHSGGDEHGGEVERGVVHREMGA